jgi:hypothetical protein
VDFVANFVNNLGNISESIPVPVSVILTITSSRSIFDTAATVTVPSFVNLATLLKFEMT